MARSPSRRTSVPRPVAPASRTSPAPSPMALTSAVAMGFTSPPAGGLAVVCRQRTRNRIDSTFTAGFLWESAASTGSSTSAKEQVRNTASSAPPTASTVVGFRSLSFSSSAGNTCGFRGKSARRPLAIAPRHRHAVSDTLMLASFCTQTSSWGTKRSSCASGLSRGDLVSAVCSESSASLRSCHFFDASSSSKLRATIPLRTASNGSARSYGSTSGAGASAAGGASSAVSGAGSAPGSAPPAGSAGRCERRKRLGAARSPAASAAANCCSSSLAWISFSCDSVGASAAPRYRCSCTASCAPSARTFLSACAKMPGICCTMGFAFTCCTPNACTTSLSALTAAATTLGCLLLSTAVRSATAPSEPIASSCSMYTSTSSLAARRVPVRIDPRHFSARAGSTASRVRPAACPPYCTNALTASTPFSCAAAFESSTMPRSVSGRVTYARNTSSSSDAVCENAWTSSS